MTRPGHRRPTSPGRRRRRWSTASSGRSASTSRYIAEVTISIFQPSIGTGDVDYEGQIHRFDGRPARRRRLQPDPQHPGVRLGQERRRGADRCGRPSPRRDRVILRAVVDELLGRTELGSGSGRPVATPGRWCTSRSVFPHPTRTWTVVVAGVGVGIDPMAWQDRQPGPRLAAAAKGGYWSPALSTEQPARATIAAHRAAERRHQTPARAARRRPCRTRRILPPTLSDPTKVRRAGPEPRPGVTG